MFSSKYLSPASDRFFIHVFHWRVRVVLGAACRGEKFSEMLQDRLCVTTDIQNELHDKLHTLLACHPLFRTFFAYVSEISMSFEAQIITSKNFFAPNVQYICTLLPLFSSMYFICMSCRHTFQPFLANLFCFFYYIHAVLLHHNNS